MIRHASCGTLRCTSCTSSNTASASQPFARTRSMVTPARWSHPADLAGCTRFDSHASTSTIGYSSTWLEDTRYSPVHPHWIQLFFAPQNGSPTRMSTTNAGHRSDPLAAALRMVHEARGSCVGSGNASLASGAVLFSSRSRRGVLFRYLLFRDRHRRQRRLEPRRKNKSMTRTHHHRRPD